MTVNYEKLRDLLAQERAALRHMDTEILEKVLERKQVLYSDLSGLTPDELADLRENSIENQRFLGAAMGGFRAVKRRIASIHEIRSGGVGYGANDTARMQQASTRLERRS